MVDILPGRPLIRVSPADLDPDCSEYDQDVLIFSSIQISRAR